MAKGKKLVALSTGAGVFVDEETNFKVLPGEEVELDEKTAGARTQNALKFGHLVEASAPNAQTDDEDSAGKTAAGANK